MYFAKLYISSYECDGKILPKSCNKKDKYLEYI